MPQNSSHIQNSPALLLFVWLVVLIPAAWGITQTALRSLDLFTTPAPIVLPASPTAR